MTEETADALAGTNAGCTDIFLLKYDSSGSQQWIKQIGTSSRERAYDVAADSSSNVYVTGWTYGALAGSNAGETDIFLLKYDTNGNLQ